MGDRPVLALPADSVRRSGLVRSATRPGSTQKLGGVVQIPPGCIVQGSDDPLQTLHIRAESEKTPDVASRQQDSSSTARERLREVHILPRAQAKMASVLLQPESAATRLAIHPAPLAHLHLIRLILLLLHGRYARGTIPAQLRVVTQNAT